MKTIKVFYSWAGDNPNKDSIEDALTTTIEKLNDESTGGNSYILEKAIRDIDSGSVNIANNVRKKISSSHIFVGDLTVFFTTKSFKRKKRALQNPNVIFEYGFAEAKLGEERCIIFKDNYIRTKKGISTFDIAQNLYKEIDSSNTDDTTNTFYEEIKKIVDKNPKLETAEKKEEKYDRELYRKLFKSKNLPSVVEKIQQSLSSFSHDGDYCDELDDILAYFNKPNKFFNLNLEKARLSFKNALKDIIACECQIFGVNEKNIYGPFIIAPIDYKYPNDEKRYYKETKEYLQLGEKLIKSFINFENKIRDELKVVLD